MSSNTISITLFKNSTANIGEVKTTIWNDMAAQLRHQVGPKDGIAFSCGTFTENRRLTRKAQSRCIISLDVEPILQPKTGDAAPQPPSIEELILKIKKQGYAATVYTTYSHRPETPRYRILIPLDRTMLIPEGDDRPQMLELDKELSEIVAEDLGIIDCVDSSKFGISSIFFVPRCPKENINFATVEVIDGRPINLDNLLHLANERTKTKNIARMKHAKTVARIAVAKRASRKNGELSLIKRLQNKLPNLTEVLADYGYIYYPKLRRWLSPYSSSGIAGVIIFECSDGVDRAYIHHKSDPLSGDHEVFGVKAHDSIDIIIAHRFGTTEEDFKRGLGVLADEYSINFNQNFGPTADQSKTEQLTNDNDPEHPNISDNYVWLDPLPFMAKMKPAEYPINALPDIIRAPILQVADFVKAPISMIASSAFGSMSLAIQPQIDVKRAESLTGPSSLYILVIAESGERKSSCDRYFSDGIRRYEADVADAAKPRIKKYDAAVEIWDSKVKGLKAQIQNLTKNDDSTEDAENALKSLMDEKPKKPRLPRFFYTDVTPEELGYSLSQTWPVGGIVSSEAGLVFGGHGMGKDIAMRSFSLFNVLWDGGTFHSDRRSVQSFIIESARLTIVLQVQEATLREFVRRTGDLARGTGFFARFLLCWPESTQGYRQFQEPPFFMQAVAAFNDRLYEILNAGDTIDENGRLRPVTLGLSEPAKQAWINFHDEIERQLIVGGQYYDLRDVASKIADNAARVAGLIHVFLGFEGPIALEAFTSAKAIVQWHLDESLRFFSQFTLPVELADAARLERWLVGACRTKLTTTVRKNDVRQKGPIRDKKALDTAIGELVGLNRIRIGLDGRASTIFVNPALIKAEAA